MGNEIGSEFWKADVTEKDQLIINQPHEFLLVGRTALNYILQDIRASKKVKSAYLPSYCCHTMIKPFIDNEISVEFYDITIENGQYRYDIDFDTECDIVLIMQYFGFYNPVVETAIHKLKEKNKIIIEDATHSWFLDNPYSHSSDYVFASFRKWTGLSCGAIAFKKHDAFTVKAPKVTNTEYIELRKYAANLKQRYINEGYGTKDTFLKAFGQAEEMLESDNRNYGIPEEIHNLMLRIDTDLIRKRRNSNAGYLIKKLNKIPLIKTVTMSDKDVPLFVPIIVGSGKRDELRRFLIQNEIYCPVHWPLSEEHQISDTDLYVNGMSIICDQRYNQSDMDRIADTILAFYGGKL
jgi:hypothetical protein